MKYAITIALIAMFTYTVRTASSEDNGDKTAEFFESSFANEVASKPDRALQDVRQILKGNPNHYIANYRAGWLSYLLGRYGEAVKYYKKASALKPGSLEAELAMLLPLMASKDWRAAESLAKGILKRAPNNYLAGSRLAFIYFSQSRYKEAERQYQNVLKSFPSELDMTLGLGWTYLHQGRKTEARAMFQEVLRVRRQNPNALAGLKALGK